MNDYVTGNRVNAPAMALAMLSFILAALSAWVAASDGLAFVYGIAVVFVLIGIVLPQSLLMANQWEKAIVLRFGKLQAIEGPGLFLVVPIVDRVAAWIDQRIQTTEFNAEQALTATPYR